MIPYNYKDVVNNGNPVKCISYSPPNKRGRPRKEPQSPLKENSPSKKRGRPRKEPQSPLKENSPSKKRGRPRKESQSPLKENSPSKKRGRPRKEPQSPLKENSPSKNRGRPRKESQSPLNENSPSKKRGRPRKEPQSPLKENSPSKKRGRPRKEPQSPLKENSPSKERGRPSKEPQSPIKENAVAFGNKKSYSKVNPDFLHLITKDSKYTINPQVHIHRMQQLIAGNFKFKLNVKVHLERLQLNSALFQQSSNCNRAMVDDPKCIMPNLPSSVSENLVTEQIINKNTVLNDLPFNKVSGDLQLRTKSTKFEQKCVVRINRYNELEEVRVSNLGNEVGKNKAVRFVEDKESLDEFTKDLRKHTTKNYKESSLDESVTINTSRTDKTVAYKEHVPVYLQYNVNIVYPNSRDPFEFISYSPSKKRGRGRPIKEPKSPLKEKKKTRGRSRKVEESSDSDSSGIYDKKMHYDIKMVRRKVVAKKNKYRKRKNKLDNVETVNSSIISANEVRRQNINDKPRKNVNRIYEYLNIVPKAASHDNDRNRKTLNLLTDEIQIVGRKVSDTSIRKNNINLKPQSGESDMFFGFDDDEEDDISHVLPIAPVREITTNNIRPISQKLDSGNFTSLTSTPLPNTQRITQKTTSKNQTNNSKQIHVISNIMLSPPRLSRIPNQTPRKSPRVSTSKTPATNVENSPSIDNYFGFDDNSPSRKISCSPRVRRRILPTPWRGDVNVTRNPHWLAVKDTSLPSYNQEMVLEPKLLEKNPTHTEESQKENNKIQSSILDFVNGKRRSPAKQIHNSSLFDYDQLSPINDKDSTPTKNTDKSPAKTKDFITTHRFSKGKRNILASIENNIQPSDKNAIVDYFGFDDHDSENEKENMRFVRKKKVGLGKIEAARPMRVPLKQLKKIREEAVEELLDKVNANENVEEPRPENPIKDNTDNTQSQEEEVRVGLFEDLEEVKPAHRSYLPKRRKRVRFQSVNSDADEEEEKKEKPKQKRKDFRAKAEEQEFNKWAAAFNAMCDEVEKHSLETD